MPCPQLHQVAQERIGLSPRANTLAFELRLFLSQVTYLGNQHQENKAHHSSPWMSS
jgi:hypothetical protein